MDFNERTKEIIAWLGSEYAGIRTGQAAPALLDNIKVENYGSMMPINQVGSVGIEDARTLRISAWDASVIPAIESAITESDLGVSVATDSAGLRVIFPELTSERREQLVKLAKQKLEDARVSVRTARDEAMKAIDADDSSDDEKFAAKDEIQKAVEKVNTDLEVLLKQKESEISL